MDKPTRLKRPEAKSRKVKKDKCGQGQEFSMIPLADLGWVLDQKPAVKQLFLECWRADPYGSRWKQLTTKLKRAAFMAAKKQLTNQGLFIFKPETSIQDGRSTVCWLVRNLHGSRVKEFWKQSMQMDLESTQMDLESTQMDLESTQMDLESTQMDSILPQTQSYQGFSDASITPHKHLNNSSKELLRCVYGDFFDKDLATLGCSGGGGGNPPTPPLRSLPLRRLYSPGG